MRLLLALLTLLLWSGVAQAQRGGGRPPAVSPARGAPSDYQRSERTDRAEDQARVLRRAAQRAAAEGYRVEDVLAAYERDELGRWFKRGEIVVATGDASVLETAVRLGLVEQRRSVLASIGVDIVTFAAPSGIDTRATLAALRAAYPDAPIDLNYIYAPQADAPIAAPAPLPRTTRIPNAVVAIIDGPIPDDAAFEGITLTTRRFAEGAPGPRAHGAAVAAILARSTATADLHLIAADIVAAGPIEGAVAEDLVRALDWAALEGAGVLNVSLTGPPNRTLALVAHALAGRGHVIVAAAGNDGPRAEPPYPAALPSVVAVTAVDDRHRIWRRATRGAHVAFAALGVNVAPFGNRLSGTSFAAPVVSGALAGLLPAPDPVGRAAALAELSASARDLGAPGRDAVFGFGLIESR